MENILVFIIVVIEFQEIHKKCIYLQAGIEPLKLDKVRISNDTSTICFALNFKTFPISIKTLKTILQFSLNLCEKG